jgi:2-keto-4-pentenoate hydratase
MGGVDPRVVAALTEQLQTWRATLADGALRVGWKLGMGDRERIADAPVIGHLTSATVMAAGSAYRPGRGCALHADAEVTLELVRDVEGGADRSSAQAAIGSYGIALELVDLAPVRGGAERIVATNVFHRAVAFGPVRQAWPAGGTVGRLRINGEVRASDRADDDYVRLVQIVAALLDAGGERLRAGDRLITGSVVQLPVRPADVVEAELEGVGAVRLSISS